MTSIIVRSMLVVVEWLNARSQQICCFIYSNLLLISLALFTNPILYIAFLRLQVFLDFKDICEQTAIYIIILPKYIALLIVQLYYILKVSLLLLGFIALYLRISMSEIVTIIGPAVAAAAASSFSPKPKMAANLRLLASLELLARLHLLILYIKEDALLNLAIQVLSYISTFKFSLKYADFKYFYEGCGGRLIYQLLFKKYIQALTSITDNLPTYNKAEARMQLGFYLRKRQ